MNRVRQHREGSIQIQYLPGKQFQCYKPYKTNILVKIALSKQPKNFTNLDCNISYNVNNGIEHKVHSYQHRLSTLL